MQNYRNGYNAKERANVVEGDVIGNEVARDMKIGRVQRVGTTLALVLAIPTTVGMIFMMILIKIYAEYLFRLTFLLTAIVAIGGTLAGLGWIGVKLYRMAKRPEVIHIEQYGTIIRTPDGKLQIISPNELNAIEALSETKPAKQALPRPTSVNLLRQPDVYFNRMPDMPMKDETTEKLETLFPDAIQAGNSGNSGNSAETVIKEYQLAQEEAKEVVQDAKEVAIKEQMKKLFHIPLPHRVIAKAVGLEGTKYSTLYQKYAIEIGIMDEPV